MRLLGDADDRTELLAAEAMQSFADGVLSRPVVVRHTLADHDHGGRGCRVALLEAASVQYPRAERAKIVRRHELQIGVRIRRVLRRRFTFAVTQPSIPPF